MSRETNFSNPKVYMKIDLTNEGSKGRVGDYAGNLCLPSLLKAWISQKTIFFQMSFRELLGRLLFSNPSQSAAICQAWHYTSRCLKDIPIIPIILISQGRQMQHGYLQGACWGTRTVPASIRTTRKMAMSWWRPSDTTRAEIHPMTWWTKTLRMRNLSRNYRLFCTRTFKREGWAPQSGYFSKSSFWKQVKLWGKYFKNVH